MRRVSDLSLRILETAAREVQIPAPRPRNGWTVGVAALTSENRVLSGASTAYSGDGHWFLAERNAFKALHDKEKVVAMVVDGPTFLKKMLLPAMFRCFGGTERV